jgi:hypothetical protein
MEIYKAAYYEALEAMINHSSEKYTLIGFIEKFYSKADGE